MTVNFLFLTIYVSSRSMTEAIFKQVGIQLGIFTFHSLHFVTWPTVIFSIFDTNLTIIVKICSHIGLMPGRCSSFIVHYMISYEVNGTFRTVRFAISLFPMIFPARRGEVILELYYLTLKQSLDIALAAQFSRTMMFRSILSVHSEFCLDQLCAHLVNRGYKN